MQTFKLQIRCYLVLLLSLLSLENYAQITISGTIVDADKASIEFASIFLKNTANDKIATGDISDGKGQFSITVKEKGNYSLNITFVGYVPWNKTLDINQSIDLGEIVLGGADNVLGEAVVTAERVIMEKRDDRLVFNVDKSPLSTGYDGMEVLQRSPNIIVDNNQNILMRSVVAKVMINGRISKLTGEDLAAYIGNLRSEDIKSIEVQTHLTASSEAENAGGLINIILKKKPIGFDGSTRAYYNLKEEGDRTIHAGFNVNYGAEKWNIYGAYKFWDFTQVSPVIYTTDYYSSRDFLTDDWKWNELIKRHNYSAGFVFDVNEHHSLGVEFFGRQNTFEYENIAKFSFSNSDTLVDRGDTGFDGIVHNDLRNFTLSYAWNMDTLGSDLKVFVDHYNQLDLETNSASSKYELGRLADSKERSDFTLDTRIFSLQADLEKNFSNGLKVEVGSRLSFVKRENELLPEFLIGEQWTPSDNSTHYVYTENITGGYLSVSKKVKGKNFFQAGIRVERTDLNRVELIENFELDQGYTDWFPSFYYSRDLPDNNSLSFSYSRQITRPFFNYLNNYILRWNDFTFQVGNPNLGPEYYDKLELAFRQKNQSFAVYYSQITDVMKSTRTLDGLITYFTYLNRGIERQYGLDYNRYGNLTDWWFIKTSTGVFQRNFIDKELNDISRKASGYINISNNFKINETTSIDLSGNYTSREVSGYCTTGANYNVDATVQKTFLNDQLTCRVDFTDIFNTLHFTNECLFDGFNTTVDHKEKTRSIRLWLIYNFSGRNKSNNKTNDFKSEAGGRL